MNRHRESIEVADRGDAVRIVTRAELDHLPAWRRCLVGQRKDFRYFELLHETLSDGFDYRYFVLTDETGEVFAVQPSFVIEQDMLAGASPVLRRMAEGVRRIFPKFLRMRTLMVGCATGEGQLDTGNAPARASRIVRSLHRNMKQLAAQVRAPLIVFKEFGASYRAPMSRLSRNGYTRVPSLPMTRLNIAYPSFEDFLMRGLSKPSRKNLRRKLRDSAQAPPLEMRVVTDAGAWADEVYPLYLQVYERSKLRFEKLSKSFLAGLGGRVPDKSRFFIWRQLGKAVAFSLCMLHGDSIYDEYLGMDYSVALDQHLYFVTLCGLLGWAIAQGYKWYYSTSLGYDPKLHLGCELVPLDLYVTHRSRATNFILRRVLPWIEPTRSDPTLRKFSTYDSLWGDA
jgi:hypothetical protein